MNKEIMRIIFPDMIGKLENGLCPICGKKINKQKFRNEISKKEFKISGLCQKCQDRIFGKNNIL